MRFLVCILLLNTVSGLAHGVQPQELDVLITAGRVMDGTGNPWFSADVGIRDERIVAIGKLDDFPAIRTIDAAGLVVAPGFIDLHSHAAKGLLSSNAKRRVAPNLVTQGITTVVLNPDGSSSHPIPEQLNRLKQRSFGPNAIVMVGHNTVRSAVMKADFRRRASTDEIDQMRRMVREGMAAGAFGLTAGLEYSPGIWSTTDELIALVGEIAPFDGAFIVHERSSGADPFWYFPSQHNPSQPSMIDNIAELIQVGETTAAKVVATHIKARGENFWGSSRVMIDMIEKARERGVRIYADQYPYNTSGSDGRLVLIPAWLREKAKQPNGEHRQRINYADQLTKALSDTKTADDLRRDIDHVITRRGGPKNIYVMDHADRQLIGKSLAELSNQQGVLDVEMAIRLQLEGDPFRVGGARLRSYSMSEMDVEAFARMPWTATATDAEVALPGDGPVHARFYGTFPRKIRHYALHRKIITVENAIRSSTSLPAQILGLRDRGQVREQCVADLVLFDPEQIRDKATFEQPHQQSEGIHYVLIGGTVVVENKKLTRRLPGKVILSNRIQRSD